MVINNKYLKVISSGIKQIPGWRTKRKIVIIESDDWGSIRMPSKETYEKMLKAGVRVEECAYNRFDSLASEDDLTTLFEVLNKFKDSDGNPPVITANCLLANPDFERIRNSDFREYHFEIFTETLKKYPKHHSSYELWEEGIRQKLFFPQFHGREHLNVARWMEGLRKNLKETRLAFDHGLFGISTTISSEKRKSYLEAFGCDNPADIESHKQIIKHGLDLFEQVFGYKSKSFIAPKYTWHHDLDTVLAERGVLYFQNKGYRIEQHPDQYKVERLYPGKRNNLNQIYLRRNCLFEPSFSTKDWLNSCLKEISLSFMMHKPAVIQSHRVNFIGFIDPTNRDRNIKLLDALFHNILRRWPDIKFMTSVEIGDMIAET
ncbi:MAG: hypothetical protein RBT64_14220 [Trichloromonas sp.]|nr:hypothetical protein [Trichloromonas sp.]